MRITLLIALASCGCLDVSTVDDKWHTTSNVTDWRDEVIYQVLVDRFADGDLNNDQMVNPSALARYQGGDWQGMIDHLDYLSDLGVTALWISPVVRNVDTDANVDGYHGYWAQDITLPNPHFGDLAKLRELVDRIHAKGMKVILDIVTNHMGQLFFYDINGNGVPDDNLYGAGTTSPLQHITEYDPDYNPAGVQEMTSLGLSGLAPIRWIYLPEIHRMPPMPVELQDTSLYHGRGRILDYTVRDQVLNGDFPGGLKDLATENDTVRTVLAREYGAWIDKADFDGFRIDTLKHVEHEFWQSFCPAIRQHCKAIGKKNFLMFGEAFDGDDQLVGSYTGNDQVDSAFFFPQKFAVIDRVIKYNQMGTDQIEAQFKTLQTDYSGIPNTDGVVSADGTGLSAQQLMINFLDNHDIPRFLFDKPSPDALRNALAFIFTENGIPCVYYGTEQEFRGGNDPQNRERLWDTGFDETGKTFQFVHQLTALRARYRPLRRGDLAVKWSTAHTGMESDAGIFAFERNDGGKKVLVVLNFSDTNTSATANNGNKMTVTFDGGTGLVNVLDDDDPNDAFSVDANHQVVVAVPPRGQKVLVAQEDQGGIP
jgi:glycosidase